MATKTFTIKNEYMLVHMPILYSTLNLICDVQMCDFVAAQKLTSVCKELTPNRRTCNALNGLHAERLRERKKGRPQDTLQKWYMLPGDGNHMPSVKSENTQTHISSHIKKFHTKAKVIKQTKKHCPTAHQGKAWDTPCVQRPIWSSLNSRT